MIKNRIRLSRSGTTLRPFDLCMGIGLLAATFLFFCGCHQKTPDAPQKPAVAKHQHIPPHQGTPVVLGNEEHHVEFVRDAAAGTLQAYVMDGELEDFVRVKQNSFEGVAAFRGGRHPLKFEAVPNNATGETVGDTSLFEAKADWLGAESNFDVTIDELTVRGKTYQSIKFNFPKGNDSDEK